MSTPTPGSGTIPVKKNPPPATPEEDRCPAENPSTLVPKEKRRCVRKPNHAGQHRDELGNRFTIPKGGA